MLFTGTVASSNLFAHLLAASDRKAHILHIHCLHTLRTQKPCTGLLRHAALAGFALAALTAAPAAFAQTTTVYSDTANFTGRGFLNGGASGTGSTSLTNLVADDITPITGFAGSEVTTFSFSAANFNTTASTFSPLVEFYSADPVSGGPGTLLAAFQFNPLTVASSSVSVFTATNAAGFFALPTGTFWAGESFTGAPAATLNNLGQGIYSPPTIGSSQDLFFKSTGPDTVSSNPAGSFLFFNGSPVANFGWSFGVATPAAVPEASTTISFGLLLALGLGSVVAAAKKKAVPA